MKLVIWVEFPTIYFGCVEIIQIFQLDSWIELLPYQNEICYGKIQTQFAESLLREKRGWTKHFRAFKTHRKVKEEAGATNEEIQNV